MSHILLMKLNFQDLRPRLNSGQLHYITLHLLNTSKLTHFTMFGHFQWCLRKLNCVPVVCMIEQAPSNHHRGSFVQKFPDKEILIVMFLKKTTDDCQNGEGKT